MDAATEGANATVKAAAKIEWTQMSSVVSAFNRGHLNPQAMQVHRKFRFIGQRLFNDAHTKDPTITKDGWHVLRLNHDIAVMLYVPETTGTGKKKKTTWKYVWRLGNVVGLRRLKVNASERATEAQLAGAEVLAMNPAQLSIQDPAAVFTVRWYHECNSRGDILHGFQNRACKELFCLPTAGECHAEPVELVSNHAVIESVQMQKVRGHIGVWEADVDHIKCIKKKFKQLTKAELVKCKAKR